MHRGLRSIDLPGTNDPGIHRLWLSHALVMQGRYEESERLALSIDDSLLQS